MDCGRRVLLAVMGAAMGAGMMQAQAQAGAAGVAAAAADSQKRVGFEVVSIRRHSPQSTAVGFGPGPDGFVLVGMPVFALFQMAYAPSDKDALLRGDRIAGAPAWVMSVSDSYDVTAKVGDADMVEWQRPERKPAMLRAMLQTLLAERFHAVVHYEKRETPVYELVVAKGGPKFKRAETTDATELKAKHPGAKGIGAGWLTEREPGGILFYAIPISTLTESLLQVGRPVVDKTGLTGVYDILLPMTTLGPPLPPPGGPPAVSAAPAPGEESIFTALPEALGLRLVSAKGLVDVLVIDGVERPGEN